MRPGGERAQQRTNLPAKEALALGALPEQVDAAGQPVSVAPLAWTDAAVLLALAAQGQPLPTVAFPAVPGYAAGVSCALPALPVLGR